MQNKIDDIDVPDGGGVQILSTELINDELILKITIHNGDIDEENIKKSHWDIVCTDVRKENICFEWADDLFEKTDHPLLLPYNENKGQLFFSHLSAKPNELIGDLYKEFLNIIDSWYPFEHFFNTCLPLEELCASKTGCLAEGPISLMESFSTILQKHGGKTNILHIGPPKRWIEDKWIEESGHAKALIIGSSFVIAEEIKYNKTEQ